MSVILQHHSLHREVIEKIPEEFKISCLQQIRQIFPDDYNPFHSGFGNRHSVSVYSIDYIIGWGISCIASIKYYQCNFFSILGCKVISSSEYTNVSGL